MFRFIIMHCGYVENNYTSILTYECSFLGKDGFLSMKEAIVDLALDLYSKFYDNYPDKKFDPNFFKKICVQITQ